MKNAALDRAVDLALAGEGIHFDLASELARTAPREELFHQADKVRRARLGNGFALCSIINAKSGRCSEDCRFCAQSGRHATDAPVYNRIDQDEALEIALDNDRHGVHRLSLVTSGRGPDPSLLDFLGQLYDRMAVGTSFSFCASLGLLGPGDAERLTSMGVKRYHCNLETCAEFFPEICTSHGHEEKKTTLEKAAAAGMSLCSGGIIGMGESMEDRIRLALELHDLGVKSIPVNILSPIAGTPLGDLDPLGVDEVLVTVALFRFINPDAVIRMAGGRGQLGSEQYRCFLAGANGAMVGNYLTTMGSPVAEDLRRVEALGYDITLEPGEKSA